MDISKEYPEARRVVVVLPTHSRPVSKGLYIKKFTALQW